MEKNTLKLMICTILVAVSFFAASCDIELRDDKQAEAPEVNQTESGILLSFQNPAVSYTYINIYRRDVTDEPDEKKWNKITDYEKIGIVYPLNYPDGTKSFNYEDLCVYKNHTYQYCVRYASENSDISKISSLWSSGIKPKSATAKAETVSLLYKVDEALYDEANQTLNFKSNIDIQSAILDYEPMLVVQNNTTGNKEIFSLPENIKSGSSLLNTKMQLVSILSDSFLSTETNPVEIEILGIVGQKKNYDRELQEDEDDESALKVYSVSWTPLTSLTIKTSDGTTVTTMNVMSPTGQNGYDWSDL